MLRIINAVSNEPIGEINEEQLEFLIEQLEEDNEDEDRYYIGPDTLEYLEENGADEELVALLHKAIGEEEGIEIRIEDEEEATAG
jgi:hypothetical protein